MNTRARFLETLPDMSVLVNVYGDVEDAAAVTAAIAAVLPESKWDSHEWAARFYNTGVTKGKGTVFSS